MKSNVLDGHVGESLRGGKNPMKVNHPVQVPLFLEIRKAELREGT